ncbi:MAG: hypothetical protein AAGB10_01205 [Pseudomonadota bacterium]
MSTSLVLLTLLFTPLVVMTAFGWWRHADGWVRLGGILGLSLVFAFMGAGNFIVTAPKAMDLPLTTVQSVGLVLAVGGVSILLAVMALVPGLRRPAGWTALGLLALAVPVQVFAAYAHNPAGGHLWGNFGALPMRLALVVLLAGWTWWFLLRRWRPETPPTGKLHQPGYCS